jgi:hypothetical protein
MSDMKAAAAGEWYVGSELDRRCPGDTGLLESGDAAAVKLARRRIHRIKRRIRKAMV